MGTTKNNKPNKRTTTFVIVALCLLASFLLPYLFIFIPGNESTLDQQAFQKLKQASVNIINKENDSRNYLKYQNKREANFSVLQLNGLKCTNTKTGTFDDSVFFNLDSADRWNIIFGDSSIKKGDIIFYYEHSIPLAGFIEPCIASSKEIFQTLFLTDYCPKTGYGSNRDSTGMIIYQNKQSSLDAQVNIDSLIPRTQGIRSPSMINITLQGKAYVMFTYPFAMGRHKVILSGLIDASVYHARIHVMPVTLVYVLLILLTLFVLSLPFLKIFMMNDRDRVNKIDLVNGGRFLFATATFITLIAVQLFLLWQSHKEVRANLKSLSAKMSDSLSSELVQANKQLILFDSTLRRYQENKSLRDSTLNILGSKSIGYRKFMGLKSISPADSSGSNRNSNIVHLATDISYNDTENVNNLLLYCRAVYNYFDQASWITAAGKESIRATYFNYDSLASYNPSKIKKAFVDVQQRDYYKYMKQLDASGNLNDETVYLAPVYSWVNSEFRVNIIRKAKLPGMFIQVIQTRLSSLVNTALSAGYGFCLMQADGTVLIHSDTLKSLRENFLDETLQPNWMKEAIASRQVASSDGIPFYGKQYALRIQPLKQTPLFLVTFYDNGYLEPLNIRILAFAILFSLITYSFLYILSFFRYPRAAKSFLFSSTDYFSWLVPHSHLKKQYFNASLITVIYILILLLPSFFITRNSADFDYSLIIVTVLTPFNLLYILNLLRKGDAPGTVRQSVKNIAVPVLVSAVVLLLCCNMGWCFQIGSFCILEGLVIVFMILIAWNNGNAWYSVTDQWIIQLQKWHYWKKRPPVSKKLFAYSCFITLFIAAIAIIPTYIYSWFAYREEQVESVKKEQLNMARTLEKRETSVKDFLNAYQPAFTNDSLLYKTIQYKKGIYSIYRDTVLYDEKDLELGHSNKFSIESDPFYQRMAGALGFKYNDPTYLPALWNMNDADNLWSWTMVLDTSFFCYSPPVWKSPHFEGDNSEAAVYFKIKSILPPKTSMLPDIGIMLLFLFILYSMFQLVTTLSRQIFLLKIVVNANNQMEMGPVTDLGTWKECFNKTKDAPAVRKYFSSAGEIKPLLKQEIIECNIFLTHDFSDFETEYTKRAEELKPLFDCVWKKCSDQEKYLLYGLAYDGLLNHKNQLLIYKLFLDKLLVAFDGRIKLIGYSFRLFILAKKGTDAEKDLLTKMQTGGSWASMRIIFFVIVLSVVVFLFLTQQEISGKLIALITSLATIIPLLLKFLSNRSSDGGAKS